MATTVTPTTRMTVVILSISHSAISATTLLPLLAAHNTSVHPLMCFFKPRPSARPCALHLEIVSQSAACHAAGSPETSTIQVF